MGRGFGVVCVGGEGCAVVVCVCGGGGVLGPCFVV